MSQKITSKNLSYNSSLPPFLAALQAQASGQTGPDPLLAKQRRAAKQRSGSEEAEDAPVVLDEEGNAVDIEVEQDGTVKGLAHKDARAATEVDKNDEVKKEPEPEPKAVIGGRKRKVGKVVGEAAEEEPVDRLEQAIGRAKGAGAAKEPTEPKEKMAKKKAKKIKLSFDDEDG